MDAGGGESKGFRVEFEKRNVPELTVKEKKELASYAHSLGDKLKSQQVGKSGVSPNTIMAFSETLESNELLKVNPNPNPYSIICFYFCPKFQLGCAPIWS